MSGTPRKRIWWVVGIVAVAMIAAVIVHLRAEHARDRANPERARAAGRPIPVRTVAVESRDVDDLIGATGMSEPSKSAPLFLSSSRQVIVGDLTVVAVHGWEGKRVEQNEVLLEVDETIYLDSVAAAEAERERARSRLERALQAQTLNEQLRQIARATVEVEVEFRTEDLARREKDFEGFSALYESGFLATIEFNEFFTELIEARFRKKAAETDLERARAEILVGRIEDQERVAEARERQSVAKLRVAEAHLDLENLKLRSPFAGTLGEFQISVGQPVQALTTLTTVYRLDPIVVRAEFSPDRGEQLAPDQTVEVVFDSIPYEVFNGRIFAISANVDAARRVLSVLIELPDPGERLAGGMSCFVRRRVRRTITSVPEASVVRRDGKAMVFVVENGQARIREVRVGSLSEVGRLELLSGLSQGEQVVVYGNAFLLDGDRVDMNWRDWAGRD